MAAGIEQKLDWQNVTILLVDNQDLDRPIGAKYTATHGGEASQCILPGTH